MRLKLLSVGVLILAGNTAHADNTKALCEFLPVKEHFVGADYVPGIDVHGNHVVPADVKAGANEFVDIIRIPITYDIASSLGAELSVPEGVELDAAIGMAEIHKNSKVLINGKDVTSNSYEYCNKEPFNIEAASVEPAPRIEDMDSQAKGDMVLPDNKPVKEEIIWGESY